MSSTELVRTMELLELQTPEVRLSEVNRFVHIQAPMWLYYLQEIVSFFKLIRRPVRTVDLISRTGSLSKQGFVQMAEVHSSVWLSL
jgi:hypothetical protein